VRFAAECLAFANMPDEQGAGGLAPGDPRWKEGVPRDPGASWDAEDVRDHYLGALFGLEASELRRSDPERYAELSRAVTGEVMAEVLGEWRRAESSCGGALIHCLRDLRPGAGWGILDHSGRPKAAYHHLRRALSPLAVWSSDEGLSGIVAHVANDGPEAVRVRLRVSLYSDLEKKVGEVVRELELEAHGGCHHDVEELLGRFVDVSWAYRFGPPAQDLVALRLEDPESGALLSQSFRLPAGRPLVREPASRLGLTAALAPAGERAHRLTLRATRFTYGVRVEVPGYLASDEEFSLEPGCERTIDLEPLAGAADPVGALAALNLRGRLSIRMVGDR
jgi:beta-mannosidase